MAVLFALAVSGRSEHRQIGEVLRAVYTYGQPMAVCEPVPRWSDDVARKLVRHVLPRDPVPALPPAGWGPFVHLGQEFQLVEDAWRRSELAVAQVRRAKVVARSVLDALGPEARRRSSRYLASAHGPQHYIAALRPKGRISELGDPP